MADNEEQKLTWVVSLKDALSNTLASVTARIKAFFSATDKATDSADKLAKKQAALVKQSKALATELNRVANGAKISAEAFEKLTKRTEQHIQKLKSLNSNSKDVTKSIASLESALKSASKVDLKKLANVGVSLGKTWIGPYSSLVRVITKLVSGFKVLSGVLSGTVAAAFAAVAGSVYMLYKYFKNEMEYAVSQTDKLRKAAVDLQKAGLDEIGKQLSKNAESARKAADDINKAAAAYNELADSIGRAAQAASDAKIAEFEREKEAAHTGDVKGDAASDAGYDLKIAEERLSRLQQKQSEDRRRQEQELSRLDDLLYQRQKDLERAGVVKANAHRTYESIKRDDPRSQMFYDSDGKTATEKEKEAVEGWRERIKDAKSKKDEANKAAMAAYDDIERLKKQIENLRRDMATSEVERSTATKNQLVDVERKRKAHDRAVENWRVSGQIEDWEGWAAGETLADTAASATREREWADWRLGRARKKMVKSGKQNDPDTVAGVMRLEEAQAAATLEEELAHARMILDEQRRNELKGIVDDELKQRINAEYQLKEKIISNEYAEAKAALEEQQRIHAQRLDDLREEAAERKKADAERLADLRFQQKEAAREYSVAQSRLAAAKSQVAQAWGWYRDPRAFAAQRNEWDADAAARKQFAKDFKSLTHGQKSALWGEALSLQRNGHDIELEDQIGEWRRKGMLSAQQEATMRVGLAKDEEKRAQSALESIDETLSRIEGEIKDVLTMEG